MKKALNPALYPLNNGFFLSHAHLTMFPNLIAGSVRITHFPWMRRCFSGISRRSSCCYGLAGELAVGVRESLAAWGGVALVGALLTIPVAGTALYIMDQYLTTRALSTPATLWVIVNTIERNGFAPELWLAIHRLSSIR